jgi:cytochrome P450
MATGPLVEGSAERDTLYWDPFDWSLHEDPHPIWRRMREEAPLYRNDKYGFYALTRFQDVLDVLLDWKTYTSVEGPILELIKSGSTSEYAKALECRDPPSHTVRRQMLSRAFTPRAVARIEGQVRDLAARILDERVGSGGFDFVDDFGALVPAMVIASMLGTPESDIPEIRRLTDSQLALADGESADRTAFNEASDRLGEYFMEHVRARRSNPGDDLTSALVTMEFTDEHGVTRPLTDMEACQYVHILSAAGNETTARFTGWAGAVLARFPEQRAKLVDDPGLIASGVEEILRFEPPAMSLARVTTKDVELHGQVVPAGSTIVVIQAATGRDQREFPDPDPDVFDVDRKIHRTLTFGFGIHLCMGASLARMEGRIVVEEMLKRIPSWQVDWDEAEIVHLGSAIRGYRKLPITFP